MTLGAHHMPRSLERTSMRGPAAGVDGSDGQLASEGHARRSKHDNTLSVMNRLRAPYT